MNVGKAGSRGNCEVGDSRRSSRMVEGVGVVVGNIVAGKHSCRDVE